MDRALIVRLFFDFGDNDAPAHVSSDKSLVGEYLEQFTDIERSPRGAELAE
jgi:hypothetical protein